MNQFPLPNYTQMPNFIIDDGWMAKLSFAEFKVLSLILRYTTGFHRREASISYKHFNEKCGVSKPHVRTCVKKLEEYGWIDVIRGDRTNSNVYLIKMPTHETDPIEQPKSYEQNKEKVGNSVTQGWVTQLPTVGNSVTPINKHIKKQVEKKHICPDGKNAFSPKGKLNELGYSPYQPIMRGKLKDDYSELSVDQKHAFSLLVSVSTVDEDDQRVNPVTAVNVVKNYSIDAIRKAILFYKQKIEEGLKPKNSGALILDFLSKRLEPLPPQASANKKFWEKHKHNYPPGSYEEHQRCIVIKRIERELSFAMSHEIFIEQFKRNLEMYKEQE